MCSKVKPSWSATEAMHNLSHFELRKLGVTTEKFTNTFGEEHFRNAWGDASKNDNENA